MRVHTLLLQTQVVLRNILYYWITYLKNQVNVLLLKLNA